MTRVGPVQMGGWLKPVVYAFLLVGIYYSTLEWLVFQDWPRGDFNHSYFVPFVILYLIWEKRDHLSRHGSVPSWKGLIPVGVGMLLFWLGELGGEFYSLYISFWLVLVGLCWTHMGWRKLKVIIFPLAMLLVTFPPPSFIYSKISLKLRLLSSQLGVDMMQLFGMSAYREGNIIDLDFTQLQVVDACNGLRYLVPLIGLGLLAAYFFKATWWKRAVLVLSTVPVAIFTNGLRIALTGILYEQVGQEAAEGFFHGFSGWLIFVFCLLVLLLEMKLFGKFFPSRKEGAETPEGGEQKKMSSSQGEDDLPERGDRSVGSSWRRLLYPPQWLVVAALLAGTAVLIQAVDFRGHVAPIMPLDEWPLAMGEWKGNRGEMEQQFIDRLDLDDYAIVDYRGPDGKSVNFYTAYYARQRKGESIHSPATCLPGSGWVFDEAETLTIRGEGQPAPQVTVRKAIMEKLGNRQLVYYWFAQRGRQLTNAYQLKWYTFWDGLTMRRTDGALVRLLTPIYHGEGIADAEKRLNRFTLQVSPVLNRFIPGKEA